MKYIIIRNYLHEDLLNKTKMNDKNVLSIFGFPNGKPLYGKSLLEKLFINDKIQDEYDYIIFVDEDCYVCDEDLIDEIIKYMDKNDYDICGMPDGGVVRIRYHRDDVPNLFFVIIKTKKMKNFNLDNYKNYIVPCYKETKNGTKIDDFESYYQILCYLVYGLNMNFLPLTDAYEGEDNETIVKYNNKILCVHTWYAREYDHNKTQKERIDRILERCLVKKK